MSGAPGVCARCPPGSDEVEIRAESGGRHLFLSVRPKDVRGREWSLLRLEDEEAAK